MEFPPFQQDGKFSNDLYRRILQYQRLTPSEFEDMQRKDLLKQRVYALMTENVIVSPAEIASFYKYKNDTFDLNYLTIDAQGYVNSVTVSDTEAGLYYDKNKEKFKVPPKVVISYVEFPAAKYVNNVSVSLEDAKNYYESHKDEFSTKQQVHPRHILFRVSQGDSDAAIKQKSDAANKVYEEIKAGGDFAALAKKYSEDPGTNFIGGDVGLVPKDSLPEPMGETLYKMNPGDVVPPIRTSLGFHILKLEGKEEGKTSSFEEVSPLIVEKLKLQRAKILAGDEANSSFKDLYEKGNSNLAAYAQAKGLEVKEIGPIAQNENIGLPNSAEMLKNAFEYPKGEIGSVVDIEEGYLIYMVKDKISSRIPEFSDVKIRVINELKTAKALESAKAYAASISKNPAQLNSIPHLSTGEFKRTAYMIPQIGILTGVKDDLDKLASPKIYTRGNTVYLVWLGKVQQADMKAVSPDEANKIKEELLSRKREAAVDGFLKEARKNHKIVKEEDKLL